MDKIKNICPKCNNELYDYDVIDWENDLKIYECDCGCIVDNNGEDITEEYED
jgi:hypothetical protein